MLFFVVPRAGLVSSDHAFDPFFSSLQAYATSSVTRFTKSGDALENIPNSVVCNNRCVQVCSRLLDVLTFVCGDEGIWVVALHVGESMVNVSVMGLVCHLIRGKQYS